MNRQEVIQCALNHAEQLHNSLENGSAPAKADCETVLGDLVNLRKYAAANIYTEELSMSIDELFQDFTQCAEDSKLFLKNMLAFISEGKIPTQESVAQLDLSIENLRQKYTSVYHAALFQLPADEMPDENAAAIEFVEAVKNSKTLHLKKQLEEAAACLKKFISVRSLVGAYTDALSPFQAQASEMLYHLSSGAEMKTDELEVGVAGPKAFLTALECKDKDSKEGIELCDKVDDFYPKLIGKGVVAEKYFIDTSVICDEASGDPQEAAPIPEAPQTVITPEPPTETAEPMSETAVHTADSAECTEDEAIGEKSTQATSESAFVQALRENDCFISPDAFGRMNIETSQGEGKKISSSIFKNELKCGNILAEKGIIQALQKRNYLTQRWLCEIKGVPRNIAEASLAYLLQKGYLRKYSVTPGGEFYCASPRLMEALTYMEASKFVAVRRMAVQDWDEVVENKASSVTSRVALANLYVSCVSCIKARGVKNYTETIGVMTDSFCGKVFDTNHPSDCELFLGAFWENSSECDDFFDAVRSTIVDCAGITVVVIASLDLAHAKAFSDALIETLGEVKIPAPFYLYSLSENAWHSYPALERVDEFAENAEEIMDDSVMDDETALTDPANGTSVDEDGQDDQSDKLPEQAAEELPSAEPAESVPQEPVENEPAVTPAGEASAEQNNIHPGSARTQKAPKISSEEINQNVYRMICEKRYYAATAYLKSLSGTSNDAAQLYTHLAYAINDPMGHCSYSSTNAFNLIAKQDNFENYLVIATALRMFFSNQVRYDYTIKSFYGGIKDDSILNQYPSLSKVLYTLVDFKDTQKKGMDAYADYRAKNRTELDQEIHTLKKEAQSFYDNFVIGHKKEKCSQKRFLETKTLMFSVTSDFGQYLKAIIDDDYEVEPLAEDFLRSNFYAEEAVIAEDTFDTSLLWNYIVRFWDEAGKHMMLYKQHADLKSRLRNNITNETIKAVQLLARWSNLVEQINDQSDDAGTVEYKKVRKGLLENLDDAICTITNDLAAVPAHSQEAAGLTILVAALTDLSSCLDGSFQENSRKYFYAPFLLTPDVVLGEDFMPDFDVHSSALASLQPDQRILNHINSLKASDQGYIDRLHEILDDRGDDYGSAQQIAEYLSVVSPETDLSDILPQIDAGKHYAKENADISRSDFIGELELAQSYGQIDNSVEDKKEMILQIINEWYEWAADTANYGFFQRVMDAYLLDIKESAKARGHELEAQLEKYKTEAIVGLSVEAKATRIARIQEMIYDQNYTVAEDLLARSSIIEEANEERIEEDFLREFLDHYGDYYSPVAKPNLSFASLVSSRTRNKEERGAKRLADNWLPGGSALGKNKLAALLTCFGFKVDSVQQQSPIGKFEHYFVKTLSVENGKRVNYTHPIAAFGSGAAQDGFRVVCINGSYDADGLIDIMKKIGDAKHTLILLDCALSMSERRRLARKSKNALGDKLFAVVDRTVMMFLVRNFDENKLNRMLISLIAPFGYYQPYVWDSANVMPPEIFMGRKSELERIKSATGVNIVYGGRQLGKSALLKKAKEDIDRDENNDRAVYIEIKGKNYKEAARKVGHELFDQHILEEDIDTTDWDELARVIRRRLQSETAAQIPYLLLLLDEADVFIESCEAVNYKPFDALKEIQSIGFGRFKFVVAGLHNVVRFKREAALGNNSVLTHLQSMTVTPFNTSEARELLEIPLHYLGLRFPKDKESLITLILASTNYFPGLIQLYCAKLLEAMRSKDYAGYDEVDTPIYEVSEDHIKKVLADPSFTQQIHEKFEVTLKIDEDRSLKVDEDHYYYLIALLMAYLYHSNGYRSGYSAADIKEVGSEFGISRIAVLEEPELVAFMDELTELNVLRKTDETHYLFTRVSFFEMMGTSAEVDSKLEEYMED